MTDRAELVLGAPDRPRRVASVAGPVVIVAAFVAAVVALTLPRLPSSANNLGWLPTIYPWWTWAIVAVGVVAGALSLLGSQVGRGVAAAAPAASFVTGAQLTGIGIVAAKHWKPAFGMGGGYGDLPELQWAAVVVAVAGAFAAVASLWCLTSGGHYLEPSALKVRTATGLVVGIFFFAILPLAAIVGDPDSHDLTSWGAAGLVFAGPWGLSLILAGPLTRMAAVTAASTVCGAAVLAGVGGQSGELINNSPAAALVLAALISLAVAIVWQRAGDE